jgi:hypothetical protein
LTSKDKKIKSDDSDSFVLQYCTVHKFGAVTTDSQRQKQHITESEEKCKFVKYNPKTHNPEYQKSNIMIGSDDDAEEKLTPTQKLLNFAESQILKTVRSFSSHTNVYGIIKINEKYRVLFLGGTECRQWLITAYSDYSGKIHGKDLYKNVLDVIIAKSITNQIQLEKIHNRICFVDNEIFYNLCNNDYELVKINKDGYSVIPNGLDNPLFRRKSNPLPQLKPLKDKSKHKNPLNELVELLKIPLEIRQLFIIHLTSLFFEKIPIPIMILQGEAGSSKSTITSTVKRIVDPSPENRNSIPDNIDDMNVHFFNRYLTNFDNISFIDNMMSDNLCKSITGHTHNKRELWTDDNEVILTIKSRIILNGVTLNIDQTDLISRSIFYESQYIQESEKLTEETFNSKIDELIPYILDQIFDLLSKTLKKYKSLESEITEKQRMADFTVICECISRELGYDEFSFVKSYKHNQSLHSFNAVESYPIVNIVLGIASEQGKDFEISVSDLYRKITFHAFDNGINIKSKYSKFPQSEKAVSNQIVRLQSTFRNSGYAISSRRYNSRDGKYQRNTRIFRIRNIDSNDTDGTSTSIITNFSKDIPPEPVEPVSQPSKQAQKQGKSGSISEYRKRASEPVKNITNQTKNNEKKGTGSTVAQSSDKRIEPKKTKSVTKKGTGSVAQLAQAYSDSDAEVKKTKTDENSKRYSHFKCLTCNAGEFGIDEKGTNAESILNFHKKLGHSIQYLNQKEEG